MSWKQYAASMQKRRDDAIPSQWRISSAELASVGPLHAIPFIESKLTPRELELTNMTGVQVLSKIHKGELTSYEVTEAVCKRAALAHQLTNCLTEVFFTEALNRARQLDAAFEQNGRKPTGPLHGLPISIKEEFDMPGKFTTWGIIARPQFDGPSKEMATVPKMLLEAGAVLFAKTNVPQALMTWESDNELWGHTRNPHNLTLGSGGSSGGEGALIGSGGSYLGVGTDIGGSIRLPGAINGLYSLKPSSKRFPYNGSWSLASGTPEAISAVQGPIARSVEDLEVYASVMTRGRSSELDPNCLGIGWRREVGKPAFRKMKFGYFHTTDYFAAVPPVQRAVMETVDALRKAGHEVVEFPINDFKQVYMVSTFFFSAYSDDLKSLLKKSGEPLIPGLQGLYGDKPAPPAGTNLKSMMAQQWENYALRDNARERMLKRFNEEKIDGLICPAVGIPSCKHHDSNRLGKAAGFCTYFNVLDLAAGTIPVTKVKLSDAPAPKSTQWRNFTEKSIQESYSPEEFLNAPISVQVVGRRWQEEKVIEMMYLVDEALKANPTFSVAGGKL